MITQRFHLKPMLTLLSGDGMFYLLALSQKNLRLFQCTRHSIAEVELQDVPRSIDEALKYDDPQKQLQYHSTAGATRPGGALMFHGHAPSEPKNDILRYFYMVNNGVFNLLKEEQAPLLLTGVDYLLPLYRDANTYPQLYSEGVSGNPEGLSPEELHQQAWPLIEPFFQKAQVDARARFFELIGTGRASNDIRQIVSGAYFGRVGSLFVALYRHQWGAFDPNADQAVLSETAGPDKEDLLDFAAIHTFLNRGDVYAVQQEEVPNGELLAAVFRY